MNTGYRSEAPADTIETPLNWNRHDPEQRLGLKGGRFTRVAALPTALMAAAFTAVFFGLLLAVPSRWQAYADIFLNRGPTQYATVFLSFWSLLILWFKWRKMRFQRLALRYPVIPDTPQFVLSPLTVDDVIDRIYAIADEPRAFVLYNRILFALSNLKNLGRVGDVDEILRSVGDQDEASLETSYSLVQGFVWGIPVLGFIGTVLGLSQSIGAFSQVLGQGADISTITSELRLVTAGLGTAFDTTLVALVAALFIQLLITALRKAEYEFLEGCAEYCSRYIVGRLRLTVEDNSVQSHA